MSTLRVDTLQTTDTSFSIDVKDIGAAVENTVRVPEDFGAIGNGTTNDRLAVQAWLNSAAKGSVLSGKPGSVYRIVDGVEMTVEGVTLRDTHFNYPQTSASFYHGIRVLAKDCQVINNNIDTPAGLVRNDTGFAIVVNGVDGVTLRGNTISRTASAAIWVTGSTNFIIEGNKIFFPLADGIHVSDNCRDGIIDSNIVKGTHDDAIAVVGDTPAQGAPIGVTVSNNIVDGTVAGHGVVLIACDSVVVSGNILRGTGYAGIGSYFWQLTGAPVAKDWANNCLIHGNQITAPGQNPANEQNVTGILVGAGRGWTIRDNDVNCPSSETLTLASAIRVVACQGVLIENNKLHDSLSYGIWDPDSNVNGAVNTADLTIRGNYFQNCAKEGIRLNNTAADRGVTSILTNTFYQCAYNGGTTSLITVTKTTTNLLTISGNRNVDSVKDFFYDSATCTNVIAADNSPDVLIAYSPTPAPVSGSWTSFTSAGTYFMKGKTVYYRAVTTVANKGSGVGLKVNLPKSVRSGGLGQHLGRENVVTGKVVVGFPLSTTQLQVQTYDNVDPISANTASVELEGWFTTV